MCPTTAASGTVRLAREQVGLFLQVVPTVTNVDENSSAYHGSGLTVEGSGLIEAGTAINFGGQSLVDDGPYERPGRLLRLRQRQRPATTARST